MKSVLTLITAVVLAGCTPATKNETKAPENQAPAAATSTQQPEVRSVLCGHNEVHAFSNSKLTVNGRDAKKISDNGSYREYDMEGIKYSVTNEDISWTAKGGVHGICK